MSGYTVRAVRRDSGWELHVLEVRQVHHERAAAAAAQVAAAERSRRMASALRAKGLSGADIGKVMGVSRGRVSQLIT